MELALGSVYVDLEISGVDQLQRTVSPIFFFFLGYVFFSCSSRASVNRTCITE